MKCHECEASIPLLKGGRLPKKCPLCGTALSSPVTSFDDDDPNPPTRRIASKSKTRKTAKSFRMNGWMIAGVVVVVLLSVGYSLSGPVKRSLHAAALSSIYEKHNGAKPDHVWIPAAGEAWKKYQDTDGWFEFEMEGPSTAGRTTNSGLSYRQWDSSDEREGVAYGVLCERRESGPQLSDEKRWEIVRKLIDESILVATQQEKMVGTVRCLETLGRFKNGNRRTRQWDLVRDGEWIQLRINTGDTTLDLNGPDIERFFGSFKWLR